MMFNAKYWQDHFAAGLQFVGVLDGAPIWMGEWKGLKVNCECDVDN